MCQKDEPDLHWAEPLLHLGLCDSLGPGLEVGAVGRTLAIAKLGSPFSDRGPLRSLAPLSLIPRSSFFQSEAWCVGRGASANLRWHSGRSLQQRAQRGGGAAGRRQVIVRTRKVAQCQQVCEECLSVQTTAVAPCGRGHVRSQAAVGLDSAARWI